MDRLPVEAVQREKTMPVSAEDSEVKLRSGGSGRVTKIASSTAPWLIIAGLLWAGLFIKPQPVGSTVSRPVIERRDSFFGITVPAPGVIWIAGSNGKIVRSDDAGHNWKPQDITTKVHLQSIAAWSVSNAIAVGNKGVVAVTSDAGTTWTNVDAPRSKIANKFMHVMTLPQGQAWVVGEMGALLQSVDYGKTWQRKRDEEDVGWNDITFADAMSGWVVGEFGRVLRTVDGGATWSPVVTPIKSSLMGVAFRDPRNGVAVGLEGIVLVTHDGGMNWQVVKSGTTEHLFSVVWNEKESMWIAAGNLGVLVTGADDASNWKSRRLDDRDLSWHTGAFYEDGKVYLAGSHVGVWDGKSWQLVTAGGAHPAVEEHLQDRVRRGQVQATPAK